MMQSKGSKGRREKQERLLEATILRTRGSAVLNPYMGSSTLTRSRRNQTESMASEGRPYKSVSSLRGDPRTGMHDGEALQEFVA